MTVQTTSAAGVQAEYEAVQAPSAALEARAARHRDAQAFAGHLQLATSRSASKTDAEHPLTTLLQQVKLHPAAPTHCARQDV
jgi:hypothetical protein